MRILLLRVATIRRTTDTFLFISHTTNLLLFKFHCDIFIGFRIIKEMPGSVASGTYCIFFSGHTIIIFMNKAELKNCYSEHVLSFRGSDTNYVRYRSFRGWSSRELYPVYIILVPTSERTKTVDVKKMNT